MKNEITNLKEAIKADINKEPRSHWLAVGAIWVLILSTFFSGIGVKAQGIEDYTTSIDQLYFGDNLKAQIYSLDTKWTILDLDRLAHAVARHETASCTKGTARYNNCFGIRRGGKFVTYKTKEDSYEDFKRIWATYYKRLPDLTLARKYSGNDRPHIWLNNVMKFYENLELLTPITP